MHTETWGPSDASLDQPSVARLYDYLLGGYHNFAVDRRAAAALTALYPDMPCVARANRAFLRRAVTFLAEHGIDQFLDIGSGIPTVGHVHGAAQKISPDARIVYVDIDPVAVQHGKAVLCGNTYAIFVQADARRPESILGHSEVQRLLDFRKPIAVLLTALLHFFPDDEEVYRIVSTLRDAVVPGSPLVLSHATQSILPRDLSKRIEEFYRPITKGGKYRTPEEIRPFFAGYNLVEPGLVFVPLWRPEAPDDLLLDQPERSVNLAGVGYKRGGEILRR